MDIDTTKPERYEVLVYGEWYDVIGIYKRKYAANYLVVYQDDADEPVSKAVLRCELSRKRWRAEVEGFYWYVGTFGEPVAARDRDGVIDRSRWEAGNYFETEEEAKGSDIYKSYLTNK